MRLICVNIGRAATLPGKRPIVTGIMKRPVSAPVRITSLGLEEDTICDKRHHGGPDQAVYVYGQPDYDWWSAELDRTLGPGTFGENLTIEGLLSAELCIGDRFAIGDALLEVTSPRIPCATLAARMGDTRFVKRFMAAERPGIYCRVVREGPVQAGDDVTYTAYGGERVNVLELVRDFNKPALDTKTIRRYLAVPIHSRERAAFETQLSSR